MAATARKTMNMIAESCCKASHQSDFSKTECIQLLNIYKALLRKEEKMDRDIFRDVLHINFGITEEALMDRVFFFFDQDKDGFISQEEWIKGLSVYIRGSIAEKAKMSFHVYDTNHDGLISRDEAFQFLRKCVGKSQNDEDPDESVKDLVEQCFKLMESKNKSSNQTNTLSGIKEDEFIASVEQNELLLEALGTYLPKRELVSAFENMISSGTGGDPSGF